MRVHILRRARLVREEILKFKKDFIGLRHCPETMLLYLQLYPNPYGSGIVIVSTSVSAGVRKYNHKRQNQI